jgi:hypothetical protein
MSVEVTLEYKRASSAAGCTTSSGRVTSKEGALLTEEGEFQSLPFKDMLLKVHATLQNWGEDEPVDIVIRRTDRDGLMPYKLDPATVKLLRTDPEAAVAALTVPDRSPSGEVRKVREANVPIVMPPLKVGDDVLADAFGDQLYFRVRGHELECPGCGFWGMFTTPGLLNDPDRAGLSFKTAFVCRKRCGCERFIVTCNKEWGYVDTTYLLEQTKLAAFYFPRAWNGGRPWVTRENLQKMFNQYKEEKEHAS